MDSVQNFINLNNLKVNPQGSLSILKSGKINKNSYETMEKLDKIEKLNNFINMNDQSSIGTPAIISPR